MIEKIKIGDEIRIIAPARNASFMSNETLISCEKTLSKLGFKVTYGQNIYKTNILDSSSIEARVADLHDAFKDKNVKAIMAMFGGFTCNQLLKFIDYNLIKENPKILCGFSDITAIQSAILKKTGVMSFYGPIFANLSMKYGLEYTLEYFVKAFFNDEPIELKFSDNWSDDQWRLNQENRNFIKNDGYWVLNQGNAEGVIIGGNLCTLQLLHGTEYMPSLVDSILFIEDDDESYAQIFDRDLQSLINQKDFEKVKGLVIGRFQKESNITRKTLEFIIKSKEELNNIPVIANADFGHTTPIFTLPIGGKCIINAENMANPQIIISKK